MTDTTPTTIASVQPTDHAMLVAWGQFAQEYGLLERLAAVPIPQKTVIHSPAAKLATLFMGLLSGIEFLSDLSHAPNPLYHDPTLAMAWGLAALPEASAVSRTLAAATSQSLLCLQQQLDRFGDPFVQRAVAELCSRNQPLLLDADLTGRPLCDESTSYPDAAFGYMDGEIRLGYQLAQVCLWTARYGRQWIVGQQHPGDTVSAPTLLGLIQATERRLALHPRRRPELLDQRIATLEAAAQCWQERAVAQQAIADECLTQEQRLHEQIASTRERIYQLHRQPASSRQAGPYGNLTRLVQQVATWERRLGRIRRRWATALGRAEHAQTQALQQRAAIPPLQLRRAELAAENARQPYAPRFIARLDAGFSSGENLTILLELGYELETKANNAALVRALRSRTNSATHWQRVGKNAEMVGWTGYQLHSCPYPLVVGLERFQTATGYKHAVLLRYQQDPAQDCPALKAWFDSYNGRGSIEAGIKQEKTVFHVQHLLSRDPIGMQIQVALTLFAANFVGWANEWLAQRTVAQAGRLDELWCGVKRLVRRAANSPAQVERQAGCLLLRFSANSSFAGLSISLLGPVVVQLELPLFSPNAATWVGG